VDPVKWKHALLLCSDAVKKEMITSFFLLFLQHTYSYSQKKQHSQTLMAYCGQNSKVLYVNYFALSLSLGSEQEELSSARAPKNKSADYSGCYRQIMRHSLQDDILVWFGLVSVIHRPSRLLGSYAGSR
jgi:hypothetical protein